MPKTKIDPRSAIKKAKDSAYAKLGPAKILKPLKFIREAVGVYVLIPGTGQKEWVDGTAYHEAKHNANSGRGAAVQTAARKLALVA
ncbi:hypothetical protein [Curvibacter lanceolatus]|uniref:hypothetical protein n=1 Tax=Curvibacter lanceolatus TaxID=86182 RepID=UPI000377F45F|nr:hypothetical protein [Curvibacter lanceolatus]